MGALCLAALGAPLPDADPRAVARQARDELVRALDLAGPDGAWHEGVADWVYGLFPVLCFADAWWAATGESLYEHPWLRATGLFRLYAWIPGTPDRYAVAGDSFPSGRYNTMGSAAAHVTARLAAAYRMPVLQWLGDREAAHDRAGTRWVYEAPYDWIDRRPFRRGWAHAVGWRLLWRDPTLPAVPPDDPRAGPLDPVRVFPSAGWAVARTGFGAADAVLTLSAGPVAGEAARRAAAEDPAGARGFTHAHAQAGHLTWDWQDPWLVSPAYGRHADVFHSVPLVWGAAQRFDQAAGGRLVAWERRGEVHAFVADLAGAYGPGGPRRLERHVLWLAPAVLVVADRLLLPPGDRARVVRQRFVVDDGLGPEEPEVDVAPGPRARVRRGDRTLHLVPLGGPRRPGLEVARWYGRAGRPEGAAIDAVWAFEVPDRAWYVTVLAVADDPAAVRPLASEGALAAAVDLPDGREAVVVPDGEGASWRVHPARAAPHLVLGLPPGSAWGLTWRWEPAPTDPLAPLRPAEADYALVVGLSPGGPHRAGPAGVLEAAPG